MLASNLPHGKHTDHLAVVPLFAGNGEHAPGETLAAYTNPMLVSNDGGTPTWGVILSPYRKPGTGMHLFPDAVLWLPAQLKWVAARAGVTGVEVQHKEAGVFGPWRDFTVAGAFDLARLIEDATPAAVA